MQSVNRNGLATMSITPSIPAALLTVQNVAKSFGLSMVLDGISLDVTKGEVVALIGASGSGKSTLLRCINALDDYDEGEIRLNGELIGYQDMLQSQRRKLGDRAVSAQRTRIGMVFQSYNLFPHLTAKQNITLGLQRALGHPKKLACDIADNWLNRVGLANRTEHYPYQLSGGQQQRVAIARALAMEPDLLLLDEVTSALDPELVGEVLAVIRNLAEAGTTMLVVSHEMGFVKDVAHRVAFMKSGRIVELGEPDVVLRTPSTHALQTFISRFTETPQPNLRRMLTLNAASNGHSASEIGAGHA
jgi:polar amino acid transport system ATP-binding protein